MPPRKSAAVAAAATAGEEDKGPTLKLVVEKGPSSGQTHDFRPLSLVKIGRLVRGNTIAIKDSGISSKHLLIQADAATEPERRGRWTITDLDSSNGTFLNAAQLHPYEPSALSDGDIIKIGEETAIRVKFEVGGAENEAASANVRRNARRRVRAKGADLVVIAEDAELGLQNNEGEPEIEAKQGRNIGTRRTRNSAKKENLGKDLEPGAIEGSVGVSTRKTRNSTKEENVDEIAVDLSVIEGKRTRGGGRGRKKQPVETICAEIVKEEPNPEHETREEEEERSEVGVDELGIEVKKNSGTEGIAGVKECNVEAGNKGKMVLDLEKMTLGEWFEYMEVYEPQYIIEESEKMLAEMRRKAERCHEYMLQQKRLQR
ncbi:hypothetical protein C2S53_002521 [Perilla frutescens var. hirtella]|uniref:FHA domain-containing protein n=1 Tax=Perilla frutescens var. hirtella TaxID=608512 RepID=A0AAD4JIT1_PERFH|nr:hypothetical protein C2S53_002521 [Perilla frutescens var. hirtella]